MRTSNTVLVGLLAWLSLSVGVVTAAPIRSEQGGVPWVNVTSFGAKGDGVVDDYPAILAAMNAGPGTIFFPPGTYIVGTCIVTKDHRSYIGAGVGSTTLKVKPGALYGCMFGGPGPLDGIEIAHMTIDGDKANNPDVGTGLIAFGGSGMTYSMNNLRFHDLVVKNATEYCMALEGGTMTNIFYSNIDITGCDRDGFDMKSPTDGNHAIFMDNIHVSNFGLADRLAGQAGLDIRGRAHLSNIRIDDVNGNHSGIRINRGLTVAEEALDPDGPVSGSEGTTLTNFQIYGTSALVDDNNEGLRIRSANVSVSNGFISGTNRGVFIDPGRDVWGITLTGVSVTKTKNSAFLGQGAFDKGTGFINCNANKNLGDGFTIVGDQNRIIGSVAMGNVGRGIVIAAAATETQIIGNYTIGNGDNWVNAGINTHVQGNVGVTATNAGIGIVPSGATTIVVNHNMAAAPPLHWIALTLLENPTNDTGPMWVTNVTATQFTIHVKNDPGASGANIAWQARTLP